MAVDADALRAAALGQPGAVERAMGIKFPCPACRGEGHDTAGDNAILFKTGKWGCAWAKDTDLGRKHWQAIGEALGALSHRNSSGLPAPTVWTRAKTAAELLAAGVAAVE
jgi:hypothetical protein